DHVTFQAGDLFEPWGVEGDVVILARVLHDWDDGPALRLLRQARRALPSGGRVFVVEMVLPEDGAGGALCDLHLLTVTGGRERTASEYAALLERTGFTFDGVRRLPSLPSVVVGLVR
ncbi:MAG: methyltransferase, partial [Rhodospirillales bacterium]|nr:methyltransferase [Rhodospirillales bacterium]